MCGNCYEETPQKPVQRENKMTVKVYSTVDRLLTLGNNFDMLNTHKEKEICAGPQKQMKLKFEFRCLRREETWRNQ